MSKALDIHKKLKGKIGICPKIKVSKENLGLIYTPGVAEVAVEIAKDPKKSYEYTGRANNVAIITDGSRTCITFRKWPRQLLIIVSEAFPLRVPSRTAEQSK